MSDLVNFPAGALVLCHGAATTSCTGIAVLDSGNCVTLVAHTSAGDGPWIEVPRAMVGELTAVLRDMAFGQRSVPLCCGNCEREFVVVYAKDEPPVENCPFCAGTDIQAPDEDEDDEDEED